MEGGCAPAAAPRLEAQRIAANDGSSNVSDQQQGEDGVAPDPDANNSAVTKDEGNSASVATPAGAIGWGDSDQSAQVPPSRQSPVVTPAPAPAPVPAAMQLVGTKVLTRMRIMMRRLA